MKLIPSQIIGTGHYVPEKILDNKELSGKLGITEDWIFSRTGIKSRHICSDFETTSQLGLYASLNAMEDANVTSEDIDMIIFCTLSPDKLCPSSATILQHALKACRAVCFDLEAACSGFVFGLTTAYQYIATGMYKTILVVGAEILSRYTDYSDKTTCILFGDGAGAVVVKASDRNGFISLFLGSDGSGKDLIYIPSSGTEKSDEPPFLHLKGKDVFRWAVNKVPKLILDSIKRSNLSLDEIDYFIIHQANQRITHAIVNKLKVPEEKVLSNIQNYGNTSAASVPILLSLARKEGKLKKGNKILLAGFGGGLTWGTVIIEWMR